MKKAYKLPCGGYRALGRFLSPCVSSSNNSVSLTCCTWGPSPAGAGSCAPQGRTFPSPPGAGLWDPAELPDTAGCCEGTAESPSPLPSPRFSVQHGLTTFLREQPCQAGWAARGGCSRGAPQALGRVQCPPRNALCHPRGAWQRLHHQ